MVNSGLITVPTKDSLRAVGWVRGGGDMKWATSAEKYPTHPSKKHLMTINNAFTMYSSTYIDGDNEKYA